MRKKGKEKSLDWKTKKRRNKENNEVEEQEERKNEI